MNTPELIASFKVALASPDFQHSRVRPLWEGADDAHTQVLIYHRDRTSPTGVRLAAHAYGYAECAAMIAAAKRTGALSPTEGR